MAKTIRNKGCVPHVQKEGEFLKPMSIERTQPGFDWHEGLTPYQRLHSHQTLASVRRYVHFRPFEGTIPKDELDFCLNSQYDHCYDSFPDKIDAYLQPETVTGKTIKRLRNTKDIIPGLSKFKEAQFEDVIYGEKCKLKRPKLPYRYNNYHTMIVGGIQDRKSIHSVKLLISSFHSPQTNAGYSRQNWNGNTFQY